MVSPGHNINASLKKLIKCLKTHPLPMMRILTIADHKIYIVLADKTFQHLANHLQTRSTNNVTNKHHLDSLLCHTKPIKYLFYNNLQK